MSVIALIFDFDDTLVPDSTTALLKHHAIDTEDFWSRRTKELVEVGYDQPMAYLNLLLREVAPGKALEGLTNAKLSDFGAEEVEKTWFPGLPELFQDVRTIASRYRDMSVEFYIISGGLQAIIEGCPTVQEYVSGVYGCQLAEDSTTGWVSEVQRCVTFTEKTRFLFEINKGIVTDDARSNPYLVNKNIDEQDRRVPMKNMIYIGDGLTDIPCFSLVKSRGGSAFAVRKPGKDSDQQAFKELLVADRVSSIHSPDYSSGADLGDFIRAAVASKASDIRLSASQALT